MRLFLFSLILPIVLASFSNYELHSTKTNPFNKIAEVAFMKRQLLEYLTLSEQLKFVATCRKFYGLLTDDYDAFYEALTGLPSSYKKAAEDVKAEIRTLYKYFKLEMEYRQVSQRFTLDTFFCIILNRTSRLKLENYFTNPVVSCEFGKENRLKLESNLAFLHFEIYLSYPYYPHFPELSLILLRSQNDREMHSDLIMNALANPFFFDKFFYCLAKEILHVHRDDLISKIRAEYVLYSRFLTLSEHQATLNMVIYFMIIESISIVFFGLILASYYFSFSINSFSFVFLYFGATYTVPQFVYDFYEQIYFNSPFISHLQSIKYSIFCRVIFLIMNAIVTHILKAYHQMVII